MLGLVFGLVYFGALLSWILLFGEMAWTALVLVEAGYVAAFGLLAPVLWRDERPVASSIGLAALWTLGEYLRGMWPLGGFTWGGLAATQVDNPTLLPLASVAGGWGVSFVVILVPLLLLVALEAGHRRRSAAVLLAAAALVLGPALIPAPGATGRQLEVAALQVDVRVGEGRDLVGEDLAIAGEHVALHRGLAADPPDLAVWGESALDPGASGDAETVAAVRGAIAEVGVPTLVGAVLAEPDGRQRNSTLAFDGSGEPVGRYTKAHLVPFGEFVPWRGALDWIEAIEQVPVDKVPGPPPAPLELDGLRVGAVICFENAFASLDRRLIAQGADFLLVTTNNASYGFSAASDQHVALSRLRAVENARWVVHAAISGISALIDPEGRIVDRTGLFERTTLRGTIRTSGARTLYSRLGDWVPWVSLVLALGLFLAPRAPRRSALGLGELPERPRTLVILPTYDERDTIEIVIERVLALPEAPDVLVVDDGSPDGTGELVRGLAARHPDRVRLIEREAKAGLASAYRLGFAAALEEGYDLVVEMDADLSHDPEDLRRLLSGAAEHHLVIGSRYVPGGSVSNWSRARLALSRGGNLYARVALGFPVRDATSGFRVYRRELLEHLIEEEPRSDGYGFQIEMVLRSWRDGFDVGERPITFREREHGTSKISRAIVLEALWLVAVWGVRERFRAADPARRRDAERP